MSSRDGVKPRRPTVQAVADLAGCSVGTVSKALNGTYVSPELLTRVMGAADALGYVMNGAARSIRRDKTMTLGLIAPVYLHPHTDMGEVTDTMITEMEEHGYVTLLSRPRHPDRMDMILQRFVEHRVDGLFYFDAQNLNPLQSFHRLGIPVVAVGFRDPSVRDVPLVTVDSTGAFDAACRRLVKLGHRVVAELVPHGARVMHASFPLSTPFDWRVCEVGLTAGDVRAVIDDLMRQKNRPTTVMAVYAIATQILDACSVLGIAVPQELSIVALTDSENAPLLRTPLSALRTDYALEGHAAAVAMQAALAGEPVQDSVVPDSVHWIERESTGRAPRRRSRPTTA